jgi:hypothetical protein
MGKKMVTEMIVVKMTIRAKTHIKTTTTGTIPRTETMATTILIDVTIETMSDDMNRSMVTMVTIGIVTTITNIEVTIIVITANTSINLEKTKLMSLR